MCAFVVLGFVFPYQAMRLAWGTSPKWPILCHAGRKATTQSINLLCVAFSALMLLVGWQEGQPAHRKPVLLICKGSLLEQVEEENQRTTRWPRSTWKMAGKVEEKEE